MILGELMDCYWEWLRAPFASGTSGKTDGGQDEVPLQTGGSVVVHSLAAGEGKQEERLLHSAQRCTETERVLEWRCGLRGWPLD